MPANVTEWDARHREAAQNSPAEPASIVSEWLPLLPLGGCFGSRLWDWPARVDAGGARTICECRRLVGSGSRYP